MRFYIVKDREDKIQVVGAVGFVPKDAIAEAPEGATNEDGPFIQLVDGVFVLDQEAKQLAAQAALAAKEQSRINDEALSYLAKTDWYVIRQQETGVNIPQDVLTARAEARQRIQR